jgi:hypothetical protein
MCCDQKTEVFQESQNVYEVIRNRIIKDNPSATKYCIDITNEWFDYYDDAEYLGCRTNKLGNVLVSLYHNNTIYLLGEVYQTIMYAPKIMFHHVLPDHIHIDDMLMKHNDVGNGSIAMEALFLYANSKNINTITGSLSSIDEDHSARRNYFYQKFGFEVKPNSIIKYLK